MMSIFTKILLWAIGTMVVSLVGFAVTTRLISEYLPGPVDLMARMLVLQHEGAQSAYENGGRERLAGYLRRLDQLFEAKHSLVDATGRDTVDGSDRSRQLMLATSPPAPPARHKDELLLATNLAGGTRLLVVIDPKLRLLGLLPYYLWIFLLIAALGYALAVYLGRPLRILRRAVEQFGRGDLSARTGSTRRDEIGELARAFDLMAHRTETLMTAERRLLQDVSHELRTPLSRLRLSVRLARTSDNREAALDRIKKEVDRLSSLVDELLQVTAAEEDPQSRELEAVPLDALMKTLVDDGAMEAEAKRCQLHLVANQPATIIGDLELIRRAIDNVLRNAIRHAPEGTAVEVGLRRQSGTAKITIRDVGIGVPDHSLTAIFDPFYRVGDDRNRSNGGVGLGLSITRRAIALLGGQIVASNAHPGLSVAIELPVAPNEANSDN